MRPEISTTYEYQDALEIFWRFSYEKIGDEEGWFAWIRRPENEDYFCVGKISEKDLIKRLESTPGPLTQDDLIDLQLWLQHGGMDKYQPKKKRRKRKEN